MEQSRNFIYSGSNDFLVIEWDVLTNEISRRFTGHSNDVRCLCVARGCLFSGSDDLSIQVSSLTEQRQLGRTPNEPGRTQNAAFSVAFDSVRLITVCLMA